MGFYLGGETFPDGRIDAHIPIDLNIHENPMFDIRGNMLHDNCLVGITT
jgi:hypothetical protein